MPTGVGPWTPQEQEMHINCLEMLAATLAVKCYAKDRHNFHIMLKMDNMSALTYINKKRGTISPELSNLAKQLWLWCMESNISLSAKHPPGIWIECCCRLETLPLYTFNQINQIAGCRLVCNQADTPERMTWTIIIMNSW